MKSLFIHRPTIQQLIDCLVNDGFSVYGPRVVEHAIHYTPLTSSNDLPSGVRVEQSPGTYELTHEDDPYLFKWSNGPQALKPLLFKPEEVLWSSGIAQDGSLFFFRPIQLRPRVWRYWVSGHAISPRSRFMTGTS